jgi:hypothetical protein
MKKKAECLKLMAKRVFGLSTNEVLETIGRYVNEKIPIPFSDRVTGDWVFIRFKGTKA